MTIMDRNALAADHPGVEYGIQLRACQALARMGVRERALQRGMPTNQIRFYNSRLEKHFRTIHADPENTRSVVRQQFLADMTTLLSTTMFQQSCMFEDGNALADGTVCVSGSMRDGGNYTYDCDLSSKIYLWGKQDTDALDCPYVLDTNIILIGDSAHAIMPTIGMGASLAIEDAEILGRKVATCLANLTRRAHFRKSVTEQVFVPLAAERASVWKELIRRARLAGAQNVIGIRAKKRFALGPQIPNDTLSRVINFGEAVLR